MIRIIPVAMALAVLFASPVFAGPCTQRIAELEKAISAKQEGGGPALSNPSGERTQAADHSKAMQALHQAKELDQQGQEQKCMQAVGRVEVTVPSGAK
jgi:hypothetical protein